MLMPGDENDPEWKNRLSALTKALADLGWSRHGGFYSMSAGDAQMLIRLRVNSHSAGCVGDVPNVRPAARHN